MKKKVFITGISGCVGHYLYDALAEDPTYELYLLVRNPQKLRFDPNANPNVTVIQDDFDNIEKHSDLIRKMDHVVHLAAAWGTAELNYEHSLAFFNLLDPRQCKKVIYFSTASILGPDNHLLKEAEKYGSRYILSKYRFYKKLPELRIYPNVVTLFPTWVLGGDAKHPYSHAGSGIVQLRKWLWLLRFFTVDVSFHYIHARDIAGIVKHLLDTESQEKNYVLGNPAITADQFIKEACRYSGLPVHFQFKITLPLIKALSLLSGKALRSWDLFCLEKRYFTHRTVDAAHFGLRSDLRTVEQILKDLI